MDSALGQAPLYQLVMGQGAESPTSAGTGQENIPDGSKGNSLTSCHSGRWYWGRIRGEMENERDPGVINDLVVAKFYIFFLLHLVYI